MYKKQHTFTLVELIVVITIMTALIVMLIPVLSNARDKAKSVATSTELRHLGLAIQIYADDNGNVVPSLTDLGDNYDSSAGFSLNGDFLPGDQFINRADLILVTTSTYGYSQTLFSDGHVVRKED